MKRRSRVWIVVGAGVVVVAVALCAFALDARSVPYGFLNGARLDKFIIGNGYMSTGRPATETIRIYVCDGTADDLVAKAQKELLAKDGWVWTRKPGMATARHSAMDVWIIIGGYPKDDPTLPPHAGVSVFSPTTVEDRILEQLVNR